MPEPKPKVDAPAGPQDTQDLTHSTPSSGVHSKTSPVALLRPPEGPGELGRLGGFRVVKLLGQGGMGAVFAAEDPLLNRPVALKVMRPELGDRPDARERFLREARAAAAIEHDNIVTVFQVGEDNGVLFLAMPLLKGQSLQDRLKGKEVLPVVTALKVAWEVVAGLAAAHAVDLVHRDIKPGNLWLDAGDGPHGFRRVKILDFGLARLGSADAHLTGDAVVGTPAFMAPEQARGKPVDARTDLFSLGGVLYRCLTGRQPFLGSTAYEVLTALIAEEPPPVRALNPEVPESLAALVHQLLAKSADARPPSAAAVLDRLRAIAQELAAPQSAAQPQVVYVPVQVASMPEVSPFADIDSPDTELDSAEPDEPDEPSVAEPVPPKPRRRRGVAVAAVLCAALAAVAGVSVVKVKGPDGKETEVRVPEGSKVDVDANGNVTVTLPRTLPVAPMPREADPAELEFRLKAGESPVLSMALLPGGERIVAGYEDGHLRVWNLVTRRVEREVAIGEAIVTLSLHPDGKSVAIGTSDTLRREWGRLSTWDLDTGNLIRRYTAFPIALPVLVSIGFADGGKQIVAPVPRLGLLLSWDTETGVCRFAGEFEPGASAFLCVHPRGDAVFVGSEGNGPRLIALASGETVWQAPYGMGVTIPGISTDGERAAFSSWGGMIAVCSRDRPQPVAVFHNDPEGYWHTAFSPDGRLLAAAKREVCVWRSGRQGALRVWRDRTGADAHRVAFTPDGRRLIACCTGGTIAVYRIASEWAEPKPAYPPLDPAWLERVHKLPADEQVKEVSAELVRRNPGFDGKLSTERDASRVWNVWFSTADVEDVSPVRGFPHLTALGAEASNRRRGKLWDLSPLAGMKLTSLYARSNPIVDLSPLRGMPLESLLIDSSLVTDLSPLKGAKLRRLGACSTPIRDLSPLAGMPLESMYLHYTRVNDLSSFKGASIRHMTLPLAALKEESGLADLSVESVEAFRFHNTAEWKPEYLRTLRAMKSLNRIDGKSVAEFWKEVDAMPPVKE